MKKHQSFLSGNFQFSEVKLSIYLNRRVYVMTGVRQIKSSEFSVRHIQLNITRLMIMFSFFLVFISVCLESLSCEETDSFH